MVHIPLIHSYRPFVGEELQNLSLWGALEAVEQGDIFVQHLLGPWPRLLQSRLKNKDTFCFSESCYGKSYAIEQGNKKTSIYSHQQYKNLLKSCISKSGLRQTLTTCPNLKYFIEIFESRIFYYYIYYVCPQCKIRNLCKNHMFPPIYSHCETSLGQGVKHVRHDMTDTGYAPVSLNADYLWLNPAEGLCRLTVFVSSGQVKSDQ